VERDWSFALKILILCIIFAILCTCSKDISGKVGSSPAPVTVASVIQKDIPLQLRVVGNAQAYATITVKQLVGGELSQIHYHAIQNGQEGQYVFVVNPDLTVESYPVTVNRSLSGESVITAHHPLYHSCDLYLSGVFQGKNQPSIP
jgi:multidrug efflux pump subunit AcrA (membrane-fusion protein)